MSACNMCRGTGEIDMTCRSCGGSGYDFDGGQCEDCLGIGTQEDQPCSNCGGTGYIDDDEYNDCVFDSNDEDD